MLSDKENMLRAIEYRRPEWIPIQFDLMKSVQYRHGARLADMMRRHPLLFTDEQVQTVAASVPPIAFKDHRFVDDWGCEWLEIEMGILGQVVGHPLTDWKHLDRLHVPDPSQQWDWEAVRSRCRQEKAQGKLVHGAMEIVEGSFFDRLQFLRGLDNLLVDLVERPPELDQLIARVLDYNLRLIHLWLEAGVDLIHFHGDIAMQNTLMMSPKAFRQVLKPAYRVMFQTCRAAGVHVSYSSDGCLFEIVKDLVECGVSYHDPQVRSGDIAGIAQAYRGKLCAMVDIDEQRLPFSTPTEIEDQVREIIAQVGMPQGGLMLYACPSADVPLENIEAICTGWERFGAPGAWQAN